MSSEQNLPGTYFEIIPGKTKLPDIYGEENLMEKEDVNDNVLMVRFLIPFTKTPK